MLHLIFLWYWESSWLTNLHGFAVTVLWWMFDYNVVIISFSFLEIRIQEDLAFNFFFLRLLEDLMSTTDLYTRLTKFFPLFTLTPTYWLKLILDLSFLCMLVQISKLEHYFHWVLSIWPLKTQLHLHKMMGTGLTFYAIWRWILVLTFHALLLGNELKTFPWDRTTKKLWLWRCIRYQYHRILQLAPSDSIVSVVALKGRHMRSTLQLPLATPEVDPEKIIITKIFLQKSFHCCSWLKGSLGEW